MTEQRTQDPLKFRRPGSPDRVLVIGGGLAGLFTALRLAPLPVTVLTPKPLGEGASSAWAQGGIAAAIGEGDTAESHAADTIAAGAGLTDPAIADLLTREAQERIENLLRYGVPFDRELDGKLRMSREAAHSARRIVRVQGDRAGRAVMAALIAAVSSTPLLPFSSILTTGWPSITTCASARSARVAVCNVRSTWRRGSQETFLAIGQNCSSQSIGATSPCRARCGGACSAIPA